MIYFYFPIKVVVFLNWIFFLRLRTPSRILLTLQYQNEWKLKMKMNKITFSDDYFILIINIIPLLFMWILWNKLARKWFHTLLSWFILIFDMIFNEHPVVLWFIFTFQLRLLFFYFIYCCFLNISVVISPDHQRSSVISKQ